MNGPRGTDWSLNSRPFCGAHSRSSIDPSHPSVDKQKSPKFFLLSTGTESQQPNQRREAVHGCTFTSKETFSKFVSSSIAKYLLATPVFFYEFSHLIFFFPFFHLYQGLRQDEQDAHNMSHHCLALLRREYLSGRCPAPTEMRSRSGESAG